MIHSSPIAGKRTYVGALARGEHERALSPQPEIHF